MSNEFLEHTRIIPVPLPYVTSLLKAYILNYAGVIRYILPQLAEVVAYSLGCIEDDDPPEMRELYFAHSKMAFTEKMYLSAASTQPKKDLFDLPPKEFFDTYTRTLRSDARSLMEIGAAESFREVMLWIMECSTHIDADLDGSLAPLLRPYRLHHPTLCQNRQANSDLSHQLLEIKTGRLGPFTGMTRVLRLALSKSCSSVDMILIIQQFVQLAMNGVDVCIALTNAEIPQDRSPLRSCGCKEGVSTLRGVYASPRHGAP